MHIEAMIAGDESDVGEEFYAIVQIGYDRANRDTQGLKTMIVEDVEEAVKEGEYLGG
jgi:hypothetical protein